MSRCVRRAKYVVDLSAEERAGLEAMIGKPNYLNFPMKPYLRKDGLQAVDTWEAVKATYAA